MVKLSRLEKFLLGLGIVLGIEMCILIIVLLEFLRG